MWDKQIDKYNQSFVQSGKGKAAWQTEGTAIPKALWWEHPWWVGDRKVFRVAGVNEWGAGG